MSIESINLLEVTKGSIVAPAGCGKTQLIVDSLKSHKSKKPVLILTHTNAGVAALKHRLEKEKIPLKSYKLLTIDGWTIRLISTFPKRSEHNPEIINLTNPSTDYKNIRTAACTLLNGGHVNDVLSSSYSNLLVDEYQDCSIEQHEIIKLASNSLPTCVLGDELQAIFGFRGNTLVNWKDDVVTNFPTIKTLTIPWRWNNAGSKELGSWLLNIRDNIISDKVVDLQTAPKAVIWVHLDGKQDHQKQLTASYANHSEKNDRILIIGCSINAESRYKIAGSVKGAVAIENVELKDLINFSRTFNLKDERATQNLIIFAQDLMTNIGAQSLITRIDSIIKGTARKEANEVENSAIHFKKNPSYKNAVDLLVKINQQAGVSVYRQTVFRILIKALNICSESNELSLLDVVTRLREQNRFVGRKLPLKSVGSTLLLKGLESEACVILDADSLTAQNLYVAMTRGSKSLTICSKSNILKPK